MAAEASGTFIMHLLTKENLPQALHELRTAPVPVGSLHLKDAETGETPLHKLAATRFSKFTGRPGAFRAFLKDVKAMIAACAGLGIRLDAKTTGGDTCLHTLVMNKALEPSVVSMFFGPESPYIYSG